MGKPSKNAGGDERMYDRRCKSSSNPSKASSSEKQGEAESSNRSKQSGVALKQNPSIAKNKNKLRSPVRSGLGNPTNRINRPTIGSEDKGVKKSGVVVKDKSNISKMKPQAENSEKKEKKLESTEPTEQVIENIKQANEANDNLLDQHENGLNGQENSNSNGNGAEIIDVHEKEEEFNLHYETEENVAKHEENGEKNSTEVVEKENGEKIEEAAEENKSVGENLQSETNSCSVDVVESTTSEVSEATESTAPSEDTGKNIEGEDANEDGNSDSTQKMKDVQIKLHDCLKDQKNEEENNADQSVDYRYKEDTFGKTLRTLSGRKSIGRHITLRERQPSPNSSLFVNTSSISVPEDGSSDYKISRPRTALSELTSSNNGTPIERKRRLVEDATTSPKKLKTEEGSLLNSSFEFLKNPFNIRRPVQVSTPYKFGEVDKQNISASEEVKVDDGTGASRKWCVVM